VQANSQTTFAEKLFTPARFGIFLALLVFAMFPQVILGVETFVARDFGFFAYPLAHFQQQCFLRGEIPFWDPYNNCGAPFLAQWNTMPLYPPALFYLALPLTWSLGVFSLLHLWWAGLGMYFLARRWTGNNFAAAFAGVAFAFNGFTLNLVMWPSHIATFSWLPWVILAVETAWRDGGRKILLAGLVGALQMLAGGPETIFLTWLVASALWLQQFLRAETPRGQMLRRFPAVVLLVFALSAAQLLPFLDLVAHAQRAAGYTDLRWSLPSFGLANFLVPLAFGNTATEGIFFQHGQYWTSSYYLGLGALWLALLGLGRWRERRVWLLAALAIVALLCALGAHTPFYPLLRKLIPQLSFITYPIKFVMVVIFAAPLLAAFTLADFKSQISNRKFQISGALLLALIAGITLWTQFAPHTGDATRLALTSGLSRAGFLLLTGGALLALTGLAKTPQLAFAPVLLVLVAWADVFTHAPKQNPTVSPGVFTQNLARTKLAMSPQPELGGSRAMLSPQAALELTTFAVSDPKNNFLAKRIGYCANANLLDGVPKVDGFFSLTPREFDAVLTAIYSAPVANCTRLEDFMGVAQISAPNNVLAWQPRRTFLPLVTAGQTPLFADDALALAAFARNDFDGSRMVILPPAEKNSVSVTAPTAARILGSKFHDHAVEIAAEAKAPALVVVAQSYYHNWRATVDGKPAELLRANVAFQAVQIPAGRHQIRLTYRDRAFQIGAILSLGALLVCGLGWFWLRRKADSPQ
jgi:Bacterial membrane protein YfhO